MSTRTLHLSVVWPALGLGLIYAMVIHRPWLQRIAESNRQCLALKTELQTTGRYAAAEEKLTAALRHEAELKQQLALLKQASVQLTGDGAGNGHSSALQRLASTIELLSQHGLVCIESAPVPDVDARTNHRQAEHASAPVATLLDAPSGRVRLRLTGSYQQMSDALRDLQGSPTCMSILSLTMDAGQVDNESIHQWIMIILA